MYVFGGPNNGITNIAASIFRNTISMSGTGLTGTNLANGQTGPNYVAEVQIPPDDSGVTNPQSYLDTSLYAISYVSGGSIGNKTKTNVLSVSMQTLDTIPSNLSGQTLYYAARISISLSNAGSSVSACNLRFSCIKLN